jgi:hypothetical protein
MRMREVGISLLGSAVVYVTMAACNGGGGGGSGASAGGDGLGGPGTDSGLVDALTDPVSSARADPSDGTRLKATYRLAADGSKEYVTGVWFDSQRAETCSFGTAGDGQERCLPAGAGASTYGDSACTEPVVAVPSGCTTPAYALTLSASTCGASAGGTHVFGVGAAASPSTIYVQSGTQCFAAGSAATGYSYFTVGAEVPATSFVTSSTGHD